MSESSKRRLRRVRPSISHSKSLLIRPGIFLSLSVPSSGVGILISFVNTSR